MNAGRPSIFTAEIADSICEQIADGKSLRSICLAVDMPAKSTVFRWLAEIQPFQDQYARAREAQADTFFEDSIDIADDGRRDYTVDSEGRELVDHDHIARSRLRVDIRKWAAARIAPKKYGDRVVSQNQSLDKNGNPVDPAPHGPVYVLPAEEVIEIRQRLQADV